jgi:signal peptidase I
LVFSAVLVIRAALVEPFGVATGSMALTLLGAHRTADCPRCGYPVRVGAPPDGLPTVRYYAEACCPNCGQGDLGLERSPDLPGDRVLVDKNVFEWRAPRRWEVVVFRGAAGLAKPYVKRVVGLPGESVLLRDGDVFIDGALARKSPAEVRGLRVPVFDQRYAPSDGWGVRWVAEPSVPADEALRVGGAELTFSTEAAKAFRWLVYRHWLLDEHREEPITDGLGYNSERGAAGRTPVHDFIVSCEVQVLQGAGELAIVITDGQDEVAAHLSVGTEAENDDRINDGETPAGPRARLTLGRAYHLELSFVDRRAWLALDGNAVGPPLDLPPAMNRPGVSRPIKIGARGIRAVVRNVRLERDVHYTAGRNATREQCRLGSDEYFMLGDNSGNSEDSRFWPVPGIPARDLLGRPLVLHQPSRWRRWGSWEGPAVDWGRIGWVR